MNATWAARCAGAILTVALSSAPAFAQPERVWLTYRSNDPSRIVINWTTAAPDESSVTLHAADGGATAAGDRVKRTLHHVEVAAPTSEPLHYVIENGPGDRPRHPLNPLPTDVYRVAFVADWQAKPDVSALLKDEPHLLICAGDQVLNLWQDCGAGVKDCYTPFAKLIDKYPELFRSTPFLPVLGNHDREIRPRGDRPPAEAVYDVDATAYRDFYPLPDDGWKWRFDVPQFKLQLVALDLNHLSDQGTTYQTCHSPQADGEQFQWYDKLMNEPFDGRRITIYNEKHSTVRGIDKGCWLAPLKRGSAAVTGFGYFAERADVDGLPCFNTSVSGKGAKYPDAKSKFFASEDGYLLLTCDRQAGTAVVQIKNLRGEVLDETPLNVSAANGRGPAE